MLFSERLPAKPGPMRKTARAAAILLILFQIQPAPALPAAGPASLPMTFDPAAFEIPEEIGSLETLKEVPGSPSG